MLTLVGDASARPLLDALDARTPERWDTSSLRLLGSGGSILSGDVKDAAARRDAVGARDPRGDRLVGVARAGRRAHDAATGRAGASLTFAPKAETMVVDDDARADRPAGPGAVGRLATTGRVPLGYYKDPERSARTFVEIDGERWTLPGDMATVDADGTIHLLGSRLAVHQHRRREGVPRGGRGGAEGAPAVADAVVVGVPRRAVGRAGRRGRAAGRGNRRPGARRPRCALPRACSPATRCRARCCVVDEVQRTAGRQARLPLGQGRRAHTTLSSVRCAGSVNRPSYTSSQAMNSSAGSAGLR